MPKQKKILRYSPVIGGYDKLIYFVELDNGDGVTYDSLKDLRAAFPNRKLVLQKVDDREYRKEMAERH